MYEYPQTPELIEKLKPFWAEMRAEQIKFIEKTNEIEDRMAKATGIEDIYFFEVGDGIVGIGNVRRNMELIHDSDLEDLK